MFPFMVQNKTDDSNVEACNFIHIQADTSIRDVIDMNVGRKVNG